ncbi:MAG: 2-oxoacid:acceptor oxidoreductase family protein [Candidatus Nealsonbacteria bacterium]|nr:2-oxoacid:acceptor oxidoreductase family protein [Candidatus Nealsonbacteria bacterium]
MEKTILIGGAAGLGSAVTSHLIGKILCSLGYYVFDYRDYPSLIKGGNNFNVLRIADQPVYSHKQKYDIILALDQGTINLHKKDLKKGGLIFGNKETGPIVQKLQGPQILANDVLIGMFFKHFGVGLKIILAAVEKEFGSKSDLIKKAVEEGYQLVETKEKLKKGQLVKYFISGNEGISIGSIAAGMDLHLAYPMTPASPVLTFLAKRQLENNILVFQPENEIAVVNMALGASFTGAKVMVGTSGGGFALMTEAISLSGMADLPLVIYLAQRTGPSTGVPTHTAQGDLKFALNAGHGEFAKIVVAPGDAKEAIIRTQEAFYLSCKYRTPAIVLGDKHLGESNYTFDELEKSKLAAVSSPVNRASSYEHNALGHTVEDIASVIKGHERRIKKIALVEKEFLKFNPVSVYGPPAGEAGKGSNLIISYGSTKGAIIDALSSLKGFRFLQISYLKPFPKEAVRREIKKSRKVILIENSATGALADVIAEQTGIIIKNKILKYDGRPFISDDIIKNIKKVDED